MAKIKPIIIPFINRGSLTIFKILLEAISKIPGNTILKASSSPIGIKKTIMKNFSATVALGSTGKPIEKEGNNLFMTITAIPSNKPINACFLNSDPII